MINTCQIIQIFNYRIDWITICILKPETVNKVFQDNVKYCEADWINLNIWANWLFYYWDYNKNITIENHLCLTNFNDTTDLFWIMFHNRLLNFDLVRIDREWKEVEFSFEKSWHPKKKKWISNVKLQSTRNLFKKR